MTNTLLAIILVVISVDRVSHWTGNAASLGNSVIIIIVSMIGSLAGVIYLWVDALSV